MPIATVFFKQLKVATVINIKFHNMKVLAVLGALALTAGCSQKLGYIPTGVVQSTGPVRVDNLSSDGSGIQENATLMGTDQYLFATGTGAGFGYYSFSSGGFISGASALTVDPRTPNFLNGDVSNVLSMAQAENNLYISSNAGLYQISLNYIQFPQMTLALPYGFPSLFGGSGSTMSTIPQFSEVSKEQFRWDSMVYVPNQRQIWGFRGNKMSRLALGNLNSYPVPSVSTDLSIDSSCDPVFKRSSALFQGKVYVAACSKVMVLVPDANGNMTNGMFPYNLNPVQVVATKNRLYIHHQPTMNWGRSASAVPAGIYIFDANLSYINFFAVQPISFAVSPDDQYLFANEDDLDIGIYRVPGTGSVYSRLGSVY